MHKEAKEEEERAEDACQAHLAWQEETNKENQVEEARRADEATHPNHTPTPYLNQPCTTNHDCLTLTLTPTLTPVVTPIKGGGKTEGGLEGRDHANREAIE